MTEKNRSHRLTAKDVLQRYMDDNLPAFAGIDLRDVNQVGLFEERPLHVATARGNTEEILALLEAGAEVNALGELGHTPLNEAVGQGNLEAARLLLCYGASSTIPNEWGVTPLERARMSGQEEILKLLEATASETS
jgi:ankyrin repeat protein